MCLVLSDASVFFYRLAVDNLAIVGEFETFWESAVSNGVSADVVGEVDEICSLCTYATAYGYGIINQLVAVVRFLKA
jgi:hypothetical protein